jgi:hypothetical protein
MFCFANKLLQAAHHLFAGFKHDHKGALPALFMQTSVLHCLRLFPKNDAPA